MPAPHIPKNLNFTPFKVDSIEKKNNKTGLRRFSKEMKNWVTQKEIIKIYKGSRDVSVKSKIMRKLTVKSPKGNKESENPK